MIIFIEKSQHKSRVTLTMFQGRGEERVIKRKFDKGDLNSFHFQHEYFVMKMQYIKPMVEPF